MKQVSERSINVASIRVMFAGGGTGGHLFPAIAIADEIKKIEPNAKVLFIGTKNKIEARIVPQNGYAFQTIWISGFHRRFRISNLLFPLKVIVSIMQARSIIKEFQPHVVVGTGGYVSGPVLRAAIMKGVPTLIQEQNNFPGVTTRMLAGKVNEVHLAYERSKKYFKRTDNVFISGNPTRINLEQPSKGEALEYFGFDSKEEKRVLLVFGGSLGAHTINTAIMDNLDQLLQNKVRIIWQTGVEDFAEADRLSRKYSSRDISVKIFIDRMDYAYAACDLVVCRAGATTIAEFTLLGKPAILVPYPHAAANHQMENAQMLSQHGAAELVSDDQVSEKLLSTVLSLFNNEKLHNMSEKSKTLGCPTAARNLALRVIQLANGKNYSMSYAGSSHTT